MRRRAIGQKNSSLPAPPGYGALIVAGLQGCVGGELLLNEDLDHRPRFVPRDRRGLPP